MQTVAELVREIAPPPPADAAERMALRLIDADPSQVLGFAWTMHQKTGGAERAFCRRVLHHLGVLRRIRALLDAA